jgi:imidazolonepropionase-like amidohydrolase
MAPVMVAVLLALKMPVEASRHALIIQGASVIDTRTGKVLENRTVIFEGGRITRVAPANEVAIPSDAQVVDARDRWILPGLLTCTCTELVNPLSCRSATRGAS